MDQKRILIVEDDFLLRGILGRKLESRGYVVLYAGDGEEALQIAPAQKPMVVLLDLLLPGMHGFDVLQALKNNVETADIPIIILSNLGSDEDMARGKELGAVKYLLKAQVDLDEIVSETESALLPSELV